MEYSPGTHIIATLKTDAALVTNEFGGFAALLKSLIAKHSLCELGEVYHNFTPHGFTGIVCLSESHISVHTWPEYGKINMDIYLSNFERNNDGTVRSIYESIVRYFEATIIDEQIIYR